MKLLRKTLDKLEPYFNHNKKLKWLFPLFEAVDTFFYTPSSRTTGSCHIRDTLDLKRMMSIVVLALVPCMIMAMYNTGLQANLALENFDGSFSYEGWRYRIINILGISYNANSVYSNLVHGALYFLPIYLVTVVVGGVWEVLFAIVRKHEVNEGFFVTSMLFPLTLPATIPLWQVAIGISFGVVVGKEVFGGTGMNFLNPALVARAFLFFAYPAEISGDSVWVAVDGFSGATPLGIAALHGLSGIQESYSWMQSFLGTIPGSMGETSALACLLGAIILLVTGIASWRIMLSMLLGAFVIALPFYIIGSESNAMFSIPPHWHLVLGGFMLGLVFMATDPVTASNTKLGQYIYGAIIGALVILIRCINPAFPEGVMLAILFGNVIAPLIDYFVVKANVNRRALRYAKE